ncbi:hypothetical protein PG994_002543 [Apiospora phragmitis]|uniref:C2H2-type domain-containing protein n=1 Tax=Apiospora phragmitis TaxID=2905665 RepID=A0ABR1W5E1_9PEZI
MASLLKDMGMLEWESRNEESDLASTYSLVYNTVINKFMECGTRIIIELQKRSPEELLAGKLEPSPSATETEVAVDSVRSNPSINKMIMAPPMPLSQDNFTGPTAVNGHNWTSIQESLGLNAGGGLEPTDVPNASMEKTCSHYSQNPNHGVPEGTWSLPGAFEASKKLPTSTQAVGRLPCEFLGLFTCKMRFRLSDVSGWIDHIRYQHLGGMLPDQCSCWFCDTTFSAANEGGDLLTNFTTRMEHISDHFKMGGCGDDHVRPDNYMLEHLRFYKLLAPPTSDTRPASPSWAQKARSKGRGSRADRRTLRGSRLSTDPSHGRLHEPRATRGQQQTMDLDAGSLRKRRPVTRR